MHLRFTKLQIVYPLLLLFCLGLVDCFAQEPPKKSYDNLTREEVMNLTYEDLMEMDLEQLVNLANKAGVSPDELLQMAMNRSASIASRRKESVFESPLTTYVISKEDIAASGYSRIPELFKMVPGAIVRQKTNGNYDVTFRGFDNVPPENAMFTRENSTLLLMIDNRIVYNYLSGGVFWETLPIGVDEIERIDIVLGAASALYGPNAMTGVINIITKKEALRPMFSMHLSRGFYHDQSGGFSFGSNIAKGWSTRVNGHYSKAHRTTKQYFSFSEEKLLNSNSLYTNFMNPFFPTSDKEPVQVAGQHYGGNANIYFNGGDDFRFRCGGGLLESEAQTISYDNYITPLSIRSSRGGYVDIALDYKQLHTQVSYTDLKMDLSRDLEAPIVPRFRNRVLDAEVNGDFDITKWFFVQPHVGYRTILATDNGMIPEGKQGYLNGGHNMDVISFGARLEFRPFKQLRLVLGGRDDYYPNMYQHSYSGQGIISYMPTPNHLIRFNYSRACRGLYPTSVYANLNQAPMYNDIMHVHYYGSLSPYFPFPTGDVVYNLSIRGNNRLKAPNLNMYELGYRWKIHDRYQLEAIAFYGMMHNFDAPEIDSVVANTYGSSDQRIRDYRTYRNLDVKVGQYGGTLSFTMSPINRLTVRLYGTYQNTMLLDYLVSDGNRAEFGLDGVLHYLNKKVNRIHTSTPQLFGGASFQLTLLRDESLTIYGDVNCMSEQLFTYPLLVRGRRRILYDKIGIVLRGNVSVAYRVYTGVNLFVAGQNLGKRGSEYGFGDPVDISVVGGLRLDF